MPFTVVPIGVARTPFRELAEAPRQPAAARGVRGTIQLEPGRGFEHALEGIETWTHLWVVWWFHLAVDSSVRKVRPPRSTEKRGVFATRSPHRPNPVGLSLVQLRGVRGLVLEVEDVDLVDGTPVVDLKPYVAYTDVAPDASAGWLEAPADPADTWSVEVTPLAAQQLAFIAAGGEPELEGRLVAALALGPAPHPYRRIRAGADGTSTIAIKAWRAWFRAEGRSLVVLRIGSGFRGRQLAEGVGDELARHRAFAAAFPEGARR